MRGPRGIARLDRAGCQGQEVIRPSIVFPRANVLGLCVYHHDIGPIASGILNKKRVPVRSEDHIDNLVDCELHGPSARISHVRDVLMGAASMGKFGAGDAVVCHDILSITKVVNAKFKPPLYRIRH